MIAIYCGSEMDTTGKPTWRQKNRRVRDDEVAVDRSEKLGSVDNHRAAMIVAQRYQFAA